MITDEQLAEWRARLQRLAQIRAEVGYVTSALGDLALEAVPLLIAEVERLRDEQSEGGGP